MNLRLSQSSLSFLFIIGLFCVRPERFEPIDKYFILGLIFVTVLYQLYIISFVLGKNVYSRLLILLFLFCYDISHFQIILHYIYGIPIYNQLDVIVDTMVQNYSIWLSSVCLCSFLFCLSLVLKKTLLSKERLPSFAVNQKLLYCTFLALMFFVSLQFGNFIKGIYDGTRSWNQAALYLHGYLETTALVVCFIFVCTFIENIKGKFRQSILLLTCFILSYSVYIYGFVHVGDRGPIVKFALCIFLATRLKYGHIPRSVVLSCFALGLAVMQIFSAGRVRYADMANLHILVRGFSNMYENRKYSNITEEYARSVKVLNYTLVNFPDNHEFLHGTTHFFNTINVIPFLSTIIRKATNTDIMYSNTSKLISTFKFGADYNSGDGTQIVADIYINYGETTTIFIFGFLGLLLAKFLNHLNQKNDIQLILYYLILYTNLVFIVRGNILALLKPLIFVLLLSKMKLIFDNEKRCHYFYNKIHK